MDVQEFSALKAGDKVYNGLTGSHGTVTETDKTGVRVRWGDGTPGRTVDFHFSIQGTAWFHWTKEDE